jgi:hypothetical protein
MFANRSASKYIGKKERYVYPFLSEIKPIGVMSSRLNQKGITLVALVIVMVIIAIGVVLMVPNIEAGCPIIA